jgi:hypothetical protein
VGGRQRVGPSDDEGSVVEGELNSFCGACRTRESNVWWKAPKGLFTHVLCDSCGATWRKYADLNVRPLREESISSNKSKSMDKREGTPLQSHVVKRTKVPSFFKIVSILANETRACQISVSAQSTPPPNQHAQVRCLACAKSGPCNKVVTCKHCGFRVHAGMCCTF